MNVYTVTFLYKNYGSALQAYALQKRLREFGASPCVLLRMEENARRSVFGKLASIFHLLRPKKNYSLFQRIQLKKDEKNYQQKYAKIKSFIRKNIITKSIVDETTFINSDVKTEDVFLAGSDQVWNKSNPMSLWYSLKWVPQGFHKYSYAASLGKSNLTKAEVNSYVEELSKFDSISLREWQIVNLFKELFAGGKIRHDIDPTLLYDGNHWKKIASARQIEEPYIFVYRLRPNNDVIRVARKLAHRKKCRIVYTGLYSSHCNDIPTIYDAGVEDFLSLIYHAEAVITNSFHGTVFSILFEKPFLSVSIATTGSRVESLLDMLHLKSQLVTDENADFSIEIDYKPVIAKLSEERQKSLTYLKSIVSN